MPLVRDGRGVLTEYDMGLPPGNPSGPVERRVDATQATGEHVHAARSIQRGPTPEEHARAVRNGAAGRKARLAADRAATGAAPAPALKAERAAASAKATTALIPSRQAYLDRLHGQLTPRQQEVVDLLRSLGSRRAVQAQLGLNHLQSVDGALLDAHAKGLLPLDLPDLPKRLRRRAGAGSESSANPAHIVSTESPLEGLEAGVPATDADERGTTGAAPATEVATPPGPPAEPEPLVKGLPCVSCSHAAVCSIKPELEAWLAEVKAPASPHEAITIVAARLEVSCVHFVVAS